MKPIKKTLKGLALFLSTLILLQGCTVYKSANVTLEEAVMSDAKVRIKTKDNQTIKYKKVGIENGNYYGINALKVNNTWVKTKINIENINKVQIKDKTTSIIIPVGIVLVLVVIPALMIIENDGLGTL